MGYTDELSAKESSSHRRGVDLRTIGVLAVGESDELAAALSRIRHHNATIVISSRPLTKNDASLALLSNVIGFVDPGVGLAGLIAALRKAAAGSVLWSIEELSLATQSLKDGPKTGHRYVALTQRELEVLQLLQRGESIRSVGSGLGISPKTVESLQRSLYRKLGARSKLQAIDVGLRVGLLSGFSV